MAHPWFSRGRPDDAPAHVCRALRLQRYGVGFLDTNTITTVQGRFNSHCGNQNTVLIRSIHCWGFEICWKHGSLGSYVRSALGFRQSVYASKRLQKSHMIIIRFPVLVSVLTVSEYFWKG